MTTLRTLRVAGNPLREVPPALARLIDVHDSASDAAAEEDAVQAALEKAQKR